MKIDLTEQQINAIRIALYHQWHRVTDDDGKAVTCKQEIADALYESLEIFEDVKKKLKQLDQMEPGMEYVETNIGLVPIEDYYDIIACKNGFNNYEDMKSNGYSIDKPKVLTKESLEKIFD